MFFVKLYGGGVSPAEVFKFDTYADAWRLAEQLATSSLDRVALFVEEGIRVW